MLIIRRKRGESITIAENVEIEILETSPNQVKLGIRAPRDIAVLRKEIAVTRALNRLAAAPSAETANLLSLAEHYRSLDGQSADPEEVEAIASSPHSSDPASDE